MRAKYTVIIPSAGKCSSTLGVVNRKIYTVSRLNQEVQQLLESGFGTLWLQGELSNFSRPSSGHFYFSLKDSQAQIRCAMFKGRNRHIDFQPQSGDAVMVRGKLGLYSPRGDYQLIVEHMEPAGAGALQAAFEARKRELDRLGWFDQAAKQALPEQPRCIGVVTSATGAALRDVLQVLSRRYSQAEVIIYPTLTQGASAAPAIAAALTTANRRAEADVLLLVRGGGSLEDLWAFNELQVAEAIRDSRIPVVAGIGHEVDVTISDLVADLRAPTPSAAAELATPDMRGLQDRVRAIHSRLHRAMRLRLRGSEQWLQQQCARLQRQHPQRRLHEQVQRADQLELRLNRAWTNETNQRLRRLERLQMRLAGQSPALQLTRLQDRLQALNGRLENGIATRQSRACSRFELLARALHGVSPLAILDRGYALVMKEDQLISDASTIVPGETITARLSKGRIQAQVTRSEAEKT